MDDRPKRNEPPRRRLRGQIPPDPHERQNNESTTATSTIMELDDESLGIIFDFLPGHFRFVASVNRRFRFLYTYHHHHTPNTFHTVAMTSKATRQIWFQEDETNVRENGCRPVSYTHLTLPTIYSV